MKETILIQEIDLLISTGILTGMTLQLVKNISNLEIKNFIFKTMVMILHMKLKK